MAQTVKSLTAMQETVFDPWVGKIPVEGNGNPFQYSCLENSLGGGAWQVTVYGVSKSRIQLSNFTSLQREFQRSPKCLWVLIHTIVLEFPQLKEKFEMLVF